jgi:hypothetical protein
MQSHLEQIILGWRAVIFLHFLKGSCGSRIGKNHRHFSQIGKTRFLWKYHTKQVIEFTYLIFFSLQLLYILGLSRVRNFSNRFDSYKNLDFRIISIRLLDIDYFHKLNIKLTISNASKYMKIHNFSTFIGIQRKVQFWFFFYETIKQYIYAYEKLI